MGEDFVLDDEFYEIFEDIIFLLSFDSVDEGNGWCVRMCVVGVVFVVGIDCFFIWMFFVFKFKFFVWKDVFGIINECREWFFK